MHFYVLARSRKKTHDSFSNICQSFVSVALLMAELAHVNVFLINRFWGYYLSWCKQWILEIKKQEMIVRLIGLSVCARSLELTPVLLWLKSFGSTVSGRRQIEKTFTSLCFFKNASGDFEIISPHYLTKNKWYWCSFLLSHIIACWFYRW